MIKRVKQSEVERNEKHYIQNKLEIGRNKERETERQRDRETERQRDREVRSSLCS